jgi:hypothetical protein
MQESEITADLSEINFNKYLQKFTLELGTPEIKRRIAFMILERGKPLDNRIKITNGKARLVQKIRTPATSLGKRINEEIEIDIPDDLESVRNSIRVVENFYKTSGIEALKLVVQHENYIWTSAEFELKITRQFGKSDLYVYEIETLGQRTPEQIQDELGIIADYDAFSDERQALRRESVDLRLDELSEDEIRSLIQEYLKY